MIAVCLPYAQSRLRDVIALSNPSSRTSVFAIPDVTDSPALPMEETDESELNVKN
ncbi:hypothetical protein GRAQ_04492 [Rahnella aquatilis CIP 78.65 = ATCC 33071]|nr:hypothetical protein GRAQ_04492 [Rahnella aquatilis CIP 78.65 = ATCC 33071]